MLKEVPELQLSDFAASLVWSGWSDGVRLGLINKCNIISSLPDKCLM